MTNDQPPITKCKRETPRSEHQPFRLCDADIAPGEARSITFQISESYCGTPINLPLRIIRGLVPGPTLFVTGGIHGDELNGAGIVRSLVQDHPPELHAGTLVLVPVVNMLGFERHSRYMPDRRDLNRCFPGSPSGSMCARLAHALFTEIIRKCDCGIDLHSAANFRTNIPNVRGDLSHPRIRHMAEAFGCELIVNNTGPRHSLREAAVNAGIPTILYEAGETWRIEDEAVNTGVRGIRNVLIALNMMSGDVTRPPRQIISQRSVWVRAAQAGLLHFHVKPGDWVEPGAPVATNTSLLGEQWSVLQSHVPGLVMGMTTLPSVKPGDPVCHIALPDT